MRTKKILLSTLAEIIPYIILGIIGFIKVRVIIDNLGNDLNGYYQFINQIIAYLFLIESGFGRAVIFSLYKPFAKGDKTKVSEIFNGSRKIFRYFGFAIFSLIVLTSIILPIFFNIIPEFKWTVILSFIIISVAYLISYFGKENSYYALFCANQKKYVFSLTFNSLKIIDDLIIIFVAIYFQSLILIALTILIIKIIEEIAIRFLGKKHFPYLNQTKKADISSFKMTKDLVWHQLSFLVSNNADIIILLYFANPLVVSIYTTYSFIGRFLNEITTRINNVVSYSFGNMFAGDETKERKYQLNDEYFILSIIMAAIISVPFIIGIRPFVGVWIGQDIYQLSYLAVVLFGFNLFLWTLYSPLVAIINAKGLYKESKSVVIVTALLNVILSIVFMIFAKGQSTANMISLVLLATAIANIINIIWRGFIVQKYTFPNISKIKTIMPYLVTILIFLIITYPLKYIETFIFNYQNSFISTTLLIMGSGLVTAFIIFILMCLLKPNTKQLISRLKPFLRGSR